MPSDSQLPSADAEGILLIIFQMFGPEIEGSFWTVFGNESVIPETFLMPSQAPVTEKSCSQLSLARQTDLYLPLLPGYIPDNP